MLRPLLNTPWTPVVLAALALSPKLAAQNVEVDEGSFRVSLNGEAVGREEFSIRRMGMGTEARIILRATVDLDLGEGRRRLEPGMEVEGGSLRVAQYQMKISGARSSEIYVSRSGRRFLAKVISPRGEEVREYRAGPGSVLLDEHVAHHYHLLTPFLEDPASVSLTVLSPITGHQLRMTLTDQGEEEIRVGSSLVQGRHYRLLGGEEGPREIWFDAQGRILRVEIPAQGYLAERETPG